MRIREFSTVPIIILTARGDDMDKIIGFEYGADDYITKPFNIIELKARVRALLRRSALVSSVAGSVITLGKITIDTEKRVAKKNGEPVELTVKEFDVFELLAKNPERVFSRDTLLNIVWGYEYQGDIRTVDVHIRRLREKLEENPAEPEHIMTKWGVGYYIRG
jgi:DNA-binding response OmpR family regulator